MHISHRFPHSVIIYNLGSPSILLRFRVTHGKFWLIHTLSIRRSEESIIAKYRANLVHRIALSSNCQDFTFGDADPLIHHQIKRYVSLPITRLRNTLSVWLPTINICSPMFSSSTKLIYSPSCSSHNRFRAVESSRSLTHYWDQQRGRHIPDDFSPTNFSQWTSIRCCRPKDGWVPTLSYIHRELHVVGFRNPKSFPNYQIVIRQNYER